MSYVIPFLVNLSIDFYLVKAVSKELVTRLKKISQVFREKDILARLNDCPYAVKLYCTFQDDRTLCKYFLLQCIMLDFFYIITYNSIVYFSFH
jgi:serine/threonine protein kinase